MANQDGSLSAGDKVIVDYQGRSSRLRAEATVELVRPDGNVVVTIRRIWELAGITCASVGAQFTALPGWIKQ